MNIKKIYFLPLLIILIGAGCAQTSNPKQDNNKADTMEEIEVVGNGAEVKLQEFDREKYNKAIMDGKNVLVYFYADWCPICKEEFSKMLQALEQLKSDKLVVMRSHFRDNFVDNPQENLAKEHGVVYQHTKIMVNKEGRQFKILESWGKEDYIDALKPYL